MNSTRTLGMAVLVAMALGQVSCQPTKMRGVTGAPSKDAKANYGRPGGEYDPSQLPDGTTSGGEGVPSGSLNSSPLPPGSVTMGGGGAGGASNSGDLLAQILSSLIVAASNSGGSGSSGSGTGSGTGTGTTSGTTGTGTGTWTGSGTGTTSGTTGTGTGTWTGSGTGTGTTSGTTGTGTGTTSGTTGTGTGTTSGTTGTGTGTTSGTTGTGTWTGSGTGTTTGTTGTTSGTTTGGWTKTGDGSTTSTGDWTKTGGDTTTYRPLRLTVVQSEYEAWWKNCLSVSVHDVNGNLISSADVSCNKDAGSIGTTVALLAKPYPACNVIRTYVKTYKNEGSYCSDHQKEPGFVCNGPYNALSWIRSSLSGKDFFKIYDARYVSQHDSRIQVSSAFSWTQIESAARTFRGNGENRTLMGFYEDQPTLSGAGVDFNDFIFAIKGEGVKFSMDTGTASQNQAGCDSQ